MLSSKGGPGLARPILVITLGAPASIGPEIAAKALADPSVYAKSRPFVIGDKNAMADALRRAGLAGGDGGSQRR